MTMVSYAFEGCHGLFVGRFQKSHIETNNAAAAHLLWNTRFCMGWQLPDRKIWINHKRVKLHVAAAGLYPEDYDFFIVFDAVANRKLRHDMERKYTEVALNMKSEKR